jgi:hypothetical protein
MLMAKRKQASPGPAGRPTRERYGKSVQAFVDPELRDAVDAFIASFNAENDHQADITTTVTAALKMYLASKNFWPPKPPATR